MKDKPFSLVESLFALMVVATLDVIEVVLGTISGGTFSFLTFPIEIVVWFSIMLWVLLKGGHMLTARIIIWALGNIAELAPYIDLLPTRTFVLILVIYLANRAAEKFEEFEFPSTLEILGPSIRGPKDQ